MPGQYVRPSRQPGTAKKNPKGSSGKRSSLVKNLRFLPLIAICGLAVSAVILFGNPILWISQNEQYAKSFAADIDKEDYQFIENVTDGNNIGGLVPWGEYRSISLDENYGRVTNVELAAQALDGYEIKPGETMSFNSIVGDASQNDEYQIADDFEGYEAKRVRGGGISQVASALYIAALKADLEIVERHAYAVVQDYAPLGFDAAIVYGAEDLRIKNTSGESLYIRVMASGQTVEVKLYGPSKDSGKRIDIVSENIQTYESPLADIVSTSAATGQAEFFTIEAYRVYCQGEVEVSRELLSTDSYLVSPLLGKS